MSRQAANESFARHAQARYERDGVQYSATSVLLEQFAAEPFEECTRPIWDTDEVIDLVAANEVIALLDVHLYDPEERLILTS